MNFEGVSLKAINDLHMGSEVFPGQFWMYEHEKLERQFIPLDLSRIEHDTVINHTLNFNFSEPTVPGKLSIQITFCSILELRLFRFLC